MNQERIDKLLELYGRNECTAEDLAALHQWYQQLETNEALPFTDTRGETQLQAQLWEQINAARQPPRVFRLPVWAKVAAMAVVLAGAAFWLVQRNQPTPQLAVQTAQKKIAIPYGTTKKFELPDGTQVSLNAGSELQYAADFNTNHRTVQLSGEAYFDVKKDAERPFIINTGKMSIRVLGTAFNVKAYPEDKTSETSLIRGMIEVSMNNDPKKKFILRPNEKIVFPNEALPVAGNHDLEELRQEGYAISNVSINPVDNSVIETAWTNNRLAFMNERFGDIAQQLERKFEVKLHFEDSTAAGLRFTATFENEDVRQTLEALQYSLPFKFRIEKKDIYITR